VETADDVLEELAVVLRPALLGKVPGEPDAGSRKCLKKLGIRSTTSCFEAMGFDPVTVDQLVSRTGLTVEAVSSMLLLMELRGQVASLSGGRYVRHQPEP
jgi:DNA processing protein